jgi:hypothetical protein
MMNFRRLSYYVLVLLRVGGYCRPLERHLDTELGREVTTAVKFKKDFERNLRRGSATSSANDVHRDLTAVVSGDTTSAISPSDNPAVCIDEYGGSSCVNGCPSLWYSVKGTGHPMTATSCAAGASYDQRIVVWGGTSCSDKQCVGASKVQCSPFGVHYFP